MHAFVRASAKGAVEKVKRFLAEGVDVNLKTSGSVEYTALFMAAAKGHSDIIRLLLSAGAEVDLSSGGEAGGTPLWKAAQMSHPEVVKLLLDNGANPNVSLVGLTPLHLSADHGDVKTTQYLLEAGAKTEAREHTGRTPLHLAANRGRSDVVMLLLEYGADPNVRDNRGGTPLDDARFLFNWFGKCTPVVEILQRHNKEPKMPPKAVSTSATGQQRFSVPPALGDVADAKMVPTPLSTCQKTGKMPPLLCWLSILCPPLALLLIGDVSLAIGFALLLIATFYTALIVLAPFTFFHIRGVLRSLDTVAAGEARQTSTPSQPPTSPSVQPSPPPMENLEALAEDGVVIRVFWPGKWFLVDAKFTIAFDGQEIATASFSNVFEQDVRTTRGRHVLQVKAPMHRATQYCLDCCRPGFYVAQLEYSRISGKFAQECRCSMVAAPSAQQQS